MDKARPLMLIEAIDPVATVGLALVLVPSSSSSALSSFLNFLNWIWRICCESIHPQAFLTRRELKADDELGVSVRHRRRARRAPGTAAARGYQEVLVIESGPTRWKNPGLTLQALLKRPAGPRTL